MKKITFIFVSCMLHFTMQAQVNSPSGVMGISAPNVGIGTTTTVSNYGVHILGGLGDPIPQGLYIQRADTPPTNQDCALAITFSSNSFSGVGIGGGSCAFILTPSINTPAPDMAFSCNNVKPQLIIKYNGRVGIGTSTPGDKLEINSGTTGKSGLRFTKLNATTATLSNPADFVCNKVLTVDNNGEVILIDLNTCMSSSKTTGASDDMNVLQQQVSDLQNQITALQVLFAEKNGDIQLPNPTTKSSLNTLAPNPFSQNATIQYTLASNVTNAELRITDASGKVVKKYILSAGSSQQYINGTDFTSGNYQYSLYVNGNLVDTKQMIIAK